MIQRICDRCKTPITESHSTVEVSSFGALRALKYDLCNGCRGGLALWIIGKDLR